MSSLRSTEGAVQHFGTLGEALRASLMCMEAGFFASLWSLLCANVWITYTSV